MNACRFRVGLQPELEILYEKLSLAKKVSCQLELAFGNSNCTQPDKAVGNVFLPTEPSSRCESFSEARPSLIEPSVAQLGETEVTQAVCFLLLGTELPRKRQRRLEVRA